MAMVRGLGVVRRATDRIRADLRADPYLRYVLALALVLALVGIWHRIPNFATWDARDRLFHPLAVYGHLLAEPSFESLQEGVGWSREPFGATFYLYALALVPVLIAAAAVGALDEVAAIPFYDTDFGFFAAWQATPTWIWTWGILLGRLVVVAFAVGSVYLTYRIGVAVRDRTTGRLAATFLALTFGFLVLAKEIGEDVPALFFLLLALYGLVRYVQSGRRSYLLGASAAGGVAIAFKLTMGPVAPLVLLAIYLRSRTEGREGWRETLWRPDLVLPGAALGLVAILLGFPAALAGRFDLLLDRFIFHTGYRVTVRKGPETLSWWWFLRGYLHGFGLPLAVAGWVGVGASARRLRRRGALNDPAFALVAAVLAIYLLLFAGWRDFRFHHLLPTIPPILLLFGAAVSRLHGRRPDAARALVAVLLLTTGLYAGVGVAGFTSMPHDEATAWMDEHVERDATMESYRQTFDNAAVTPWLNVSHPNAGGEPAACPDYIQLTYRDLTYLRDAPPEHRGYYAENVSERAAYVRALVEGETNYELAAEFGPRPPNFVPERAPPGSVVDVLHLGIVPHTDQYGDEQDLRPNQYVAIFERTGPCERPRDVPW